MLRAERGSVGFSGVEEGHDQINPERHNARADDEDDDRDRPPPCRGAVVHPKTEREQGDEQAGRDEGSDDHGEKGSPVDDHGAPASVGPVTGVEGDFFLRSFGRTNTPGAGWVKWRASMRRLRANRYTVRIAPSASTTSRITPT